MSLMFSPGVFEHKMLRLIGDGERHHSFDIAAFRVEGDGDDADALAREAARDAAWATYRDARHDLLVRHGCVEMARPWQLEPDCWIVELFLTERGVAALAALDEGLVWNPAEAQADLAATERLYRQWLPSRLGEPISDRALGRIGRLTHPRLQGVVRDAMLAKLAYDPA